MKTKLDSFEQNIEDNASSFNHISTNKGKIINSIINEAKKSKNINIRISEFDLERLKEKSASEGLPYQTMVSSIIHKYVTDQLIDEKDIIKSIQLISIQNQ